MAISAGKRILKWIAWIVGGFVAFVLVAYLALVAINWRDQPPSAQARRFEELLRNRPTVPAAENGHAFIMAFDSVPEARGYKQSRLHGVKEFSAACRFGDSKCAAALESGEGVMQEWLVSEQWLLDRYLTLLQHSGWLETKSFEVSAPIPPYSLVTDGQKLLLSKAYLLAARKDVAGIRDLLSRDVRFWRHALVSSDILLTKVVVVSALTRHFGFGNLILRRLPADLQLAAMPDEWRTPLTDEERSMLRPFVGEWHFARSYFRKSAATGERILDFVPDSKPAFIDRLRLPLVRPLYKVQDTLNRRAEILAYAANKLNVPFAELPVAIDEVQYDLEDPLGEIGISDVLYNPMGQATLLEASSGYAPYAARVSDIEGARRIAVLATELRSRGVTRAEVPFTLSTSATRSPYDDLPFAWDAEEQSIIFIGLQRGERARHAFRY